MKCGKAAWNAEKGLFVAERRERSERSEANNRVLFEIPQYLYIYIYIYIYIYVCLHVHCTRPWTPYVSPITSAIVHLEHWLLFGAPLWGVALSLGMADGASSAEDSPDDDSNFSRTSTTTGHRKRLDDDSDLGRTRTATGQKKRSLTSQTAAQREEQVAEDGKGRRSGSWTTSAYSFLYYFFVLYMYLAIYII